MTDLDDRLTAELTRAVADAGLRPPTLDDVIAGAARRRQRRLRRAALAVAALAMAAAGTVALLTDEAPSRTDVVDDDRTPTTHEPTTTGPPTTANTTPSSTAPPATTPSTLTPSTTAPPTPGQPVADSLLLRANGVGAFTFGAPMDDVVAAVTAELGDSVSGSPVTTIGEPCTGADTTWLTAKQTGWYGFILTFAGPDAGSLRLVGWSASGSTDRSHDLRMDGGPRVSEPLSAWVEAYGAVLDVAPTPGGSGDSVTLSLPEGAVTAYTVGEEETLTLFAGATCPLGD